jgi:transcription antitermination factor NusB
MSRRAAPTPIIPARVTVEQLATALGVEVSEVQAVLAARGEPSLPEDVVGADLALSIASALGLPLAVEPRDLALEILYQVELGGGGTEDLSDLPGRVALLVAGVLENKEELDHEIESASEHWSVSRMPVIDRSILRLGLFELRHGGDTPVGVVIAEAVRLAKTYSTDKSGAFVNGVLASLARSGR